MKHYFGVAIFKSGDAAVTRPCDTEEQVRHALEHFIRKHPHDVESTTWMIREQDDLKAVFGKPRSRDLMQDKKFLKTL